VSWSLLLSSSKAASHVLCLYASVPAQQVLQHPLLPLSEPASMHACTHMCVCARVSFCLLMGFSLICSSPLHHHHLRNKEIIILFIFSFFLVWELSAYASAGLGGDMATSLLEPIIGELRRAVEESDPAPCALRVIEVLVPLVYRPALKVILVPVLLSCLFFPSVPLSTCHLSPLLPEFDIRPRFTNSGVFWLVLFQKVQLTRASRRTCLRSWCGRGLVLY
jgi:hypothetical protein